MMGTKLRRGCQSHADFWPSRDRALDLLRRTQSPIGTLDARYREGPVTPRGVAVFEIGACPKVA